MTVLTKDTLPAYLRPMAGKPSMKLNHCAVCGASAPLNDHHIIRRGAGKAFDGYGNELKKPTITLCGNGNTSGCHGLAHQQMLHFRWVDQPKTASGWGTYGAGHWEWLATEPMKELQAQQIAEGWHRCR